MNKLYIFDIMRRCLAILTLMVFVFTANAQMPPPNASYGIEVRRLIADSTLMIPTICGTPSSYSNLKIASQYIKKSAVLFDSCGHNFYVWDGSTSTWISFLNNTSGKLLADTFFTTGYTTRARLKKSIDSLAALVPSTPTLAQVTAAGNTTPNSITTTSLVTAQNMSAIGNITGGAISATTGTFANFLSVGGAGALINGNFETNGAVRFNGLFLSTTALTGSVLAFSSTSDYVSYVPIPASGIGSMTGMTYITANGITASFTGSGSAVPTTTLTMPNPTFSTTTVQGAVSIAGTTTLSANLSFSGTNLGMSGFNFLLTTVNGNNTAGSSAYHSWFDATSANGMLLQLNANNDLAFFGRTSSVNQTSNITTIGRTGLITTATGITFGTTSTLNYYEEGTVTVTATCGTSGTVTLGANTLRFTRTGNVVYFTGLINVSSVSSPVGTFTLSGLPYTAGNSFANYAGVAVHALGLAATATTSIEAFILGNTKNIQIDKFSAGASAALAGDVTNGTAFRISGHYMIN